MLIIQKSTKKDISIEMDIMNSNPHFNFISVGKKLLDDKDILKEHDEGDRMEKERYLVRMDHHFIGILDFTMKNPSDQSPWIGLLIIHRNFQAMGLGDSLYTLYENEMIKRGVSEVRLGCLEENKKGYSFWSRQGFNTYKKVLFDERPMFCMRKELYLSKKTQH